MPEDLSKMVPNTFKEKLASGQVVSTLSIRIFRGIEIIHIAKSCGFDAVYIDLQHSSLSLETTSQLSIAALGVGIPSIVRVPTCKLEYISRVLDGGAMGVLAPDIDTPEEAQRVVAFSKFPPIGERSTGGGLPQLQYRNWPQTEAFEVMNAATVVMVQIESPSAVENADEIIAVRGVDAVMVGTNDLCAGYGIPGQHGHELIRKAYNRIIEAGRKYGKYVGIGGISDRKLLAEYVKAGARIIATGTDISVILAAGSERAQFVSSLNK